MTQNKDLVTDAQTVLEEDLSEKKSPDFTHRLTIYIGALTEMKMLQSSKSLSYISSILYRYRMYSV